MDDSELYPSELDKALIALFPPTNQERAERYARILNEQHKTTGDWYAARDRYIWKDVINNKHNQYPRVVVVETFGNWVVLKY